MAAVLVSAVSFILGMNAVIVPAAAATDTAPNLPFLDLSVALANRVHRYMLNPASGAYYFSVSSDWKAVSTAEYSTLGNAMIVYGLLQLFKTTDNSTYLEWASTTSDAFWKFAWSSPLGGFYDTYSPNWSNSTCQQGVQGNAMLEIDYLTLSEMNGSSVWSQRATELEKFVNSRFWDSTAGTIQVGYDACNGKSSGDADIEQSIGSYLWATSLWTRATGNMSYVPAMESVAAFASRALWDSANNTLQGGAGSTGCDVPSGHLGFMRSVSLSPLRLEDCRKGANENIWGAVGLASLYSITRSSALLDVVESDLDWINGTFWDSVNGGYHNNVFRDGTLKSSCSSTNDPRDYPGWTVGEQPMFWWIIGSIVDSAKMKAWSLVAANWAARYQWNHTAGNGGEMTCLDVNRLPDSGSTDLFDWVQASGIYSYSAITNRSATVTTSTVPEFSLLSLPIVAAVLLATTLLVLGRLSRGARR